MAGDNASLQGVEGTGAQLVEALGARIDLEEGRLPFQAKTKALIEEEPEDDDSVGDGRRAEVPSPSTPKEAFKKTTPAIAKGSGKGVGALVHDIAVTWGFDAATARSAIHVLGTNGVTVRPFSARATRVLFLRLAFWRHRPCSLSSRQKK